jgi:hypothetical protein
MGYAGATRKESNFAVTVRTRLSSFQWKENTQRIPGKVRYKIMAETLTEILQKVQDHHEDLQVLKGGHVGRL